jgi:glucose-1-phosphate thymidylyltransferase
MKALILAAGYATRLYPLTKDTPKPLLEVSGKPIINYIVDKIATIPNVDGIYVVTNNKFHTHFQAWANNLNCSKPITIVNDQTTSNDDRLGAIGDIDFVVKQENINEDLLVIAGDNLFGFALQNFVDFFHQKANSIVAFHNLQDLEKVRGRYGVAILDNTKVIDFEEKPREPKSTLAATACYLFNQQDLQKVDSFLREEKADAPGNLVRYLAKNSEVHGFVFTEHWFDVGTLPSLEEARQAYED